MAPVVPVHGVTPASNPPFWISSEAGVPPPTVKATEGDVPTLPAASYAFATRL